MSLLVRHTLAPADTGPALRALVDWTPTDIPGGGAHPGDIGWQLRFPDATVLLWTDDGTPVAVGFLDSGVLRVTTAPGSGEALAADVEELLGDGACDGLPLPGRVPDQTESWLAMSWTPRPVSTRAEPVRESNAADRVLVQRAAFPSSTFTVERWHAMKQSPAGGSAVEFLTRTPTGAPAAAVTGWFAGVGRCGLLEPVGTAPEHRGHGYGRAAVLATCAALVEQGASAVAVVPTSSNPAAVALYRSAGFTVVSEHRDWVRPRVQ